MARMRTTRTLDDDLAVARGLRSSEDAKRTGIYHSARSVEDFEGAQRAIDRLVAAIDRADRVADPEERQVESGRADAPAAALRQRGQRDQRDRRAHQMTTPPFGLITWPTR